MNARVRRYPLLLEVCCPYFIHPPYDVHILLSIHVFTWMLYG